LVRPGQRVDGTVEGEDARALVDQAVEIRSELVLGAKLLLGIELALNDVELAIDFGQAPSGSTRMRP
jgi:hypothetical protein